MKAASGRQCWQINNLKDSQFGENVAENRTQKLPEKKRDSWVIVSTSRHSKKKKCQNNNACGICNEIFSYIL